MTNSILAENSRHMESIIRKATEIELNPNNMNRGDGFSQNRSHPERTKKGSIQEHDTHSLLIWPSYLRGGLKGLQFPPLSIDPFFLSRPQNGRLSLLFLST
jgi:hypothetical protein